MVCKRLSALILLFLFLLTVLPACSNTDEKKAKYYKRALEYIKIDKPQAAIIELKNAIKLDEKFADARYQLALLYIKTDKPGNGFKELKKTADLDPENLDAGVKVAEFYLLSRDVKKSRKQVEKVLAVKPDYKDALSLLANIALIEGDLKAAKDAVDKALALDPDNDKLYNIKGRVALAAGDLKDAEKLFTKAVSLNSDKFANHKTLFMYYQRTNNSKAQQEQLSAMANHFSNDPQFYILQSKFHQLQGETEKAEKALLKTVEIKSNSASLRLVLADFYKEQHNYDKAEATLRQALKDFADNIRIRASLAELLFNLKKFDEAKKEMQSILSDNPKNGKATLIQARFLIKDGKNPEAAAMLASLVDNYPKWSEPFYYSALANLRIGKIKLAEKAIMLALKNDRKKDKYHALAAQIALVQGDSNKAGREASIALSLNHRNYAGAKILAQAFVQAKKYDKAIALIKEMQPQKNNDIDLLGNLSMAYLGNKQKEKALETLKQILAIRPDNTKALALLVALTSKKNVQKGIALVQDQIEKGPASGHYLLLGDLFTKNHQPEEALRAFQQARELSPDEPQGYILRARLLKTMGKIKESENEYNELLTRHPDSTSARMGLANIYEQSGRIALAKQTYKQLLEKQPDNSIAANNLAWLISSEKDGDLGEALRLAMQAKQALPDQPIIADTLGWVHYKRKSYPLAISQYRQALKKDADNPEILYHLALALHDNGAKDKAITVLEKSTSGQPFKELQAAKKKLKEWRDK